MKFKFSNSLAIFLLALVLVFPFQGSRPFIGRDEHRYPEVAYEMLQNGDFLIPHFRGRIHLTKPPLTYWAIVVGYKIFGVNPWGARFPNALAFALTAVFVFLIGRELWGREAGSLAALIYMGMLVPFAAANVVTTDTLLVMWETAAIWAFLRGIKGERKAWFVLMWFFWALGFLTKGTAIFPVAAGTFLFWWLKRKKFSDPFSVTGLLIFLILGFSWYFYVWIHVPGALKTFWVEQIYGRLFSDVFHRNSKWYAPFYLYFPLLTIGSLPVPIFWIKVFSHFSWKEIKEKIVKDQNCFFLLSQFITPLIIFVIAKSRLPLYILPLFVPLALFTAYFSTLCSFRYFYFFFIWYIFLECLKLFSVYLSIYY